MTLAFGLFGFFLSVFKDNLQYTSFSVTVGNYYNKTDHLLGKLLVSMTQFRCTLQPQTKLEIFLMSALEEKQGMIAYKAAFALSA